jgi:hypothetical protein
MRKYFFLFSVLLFFTIPGYAQDDDCMNYGDASQDPSRANCVFIDCRMDDCNDFFNNLDEYTSLSKLEIVDFDHDYFPRDLSGLKQLECITITQSPGLNYTLLLRKLAGITTLKKLVLDNNGLRAIPKTLPMLQSIEALVIRNNEDFDVEKSIFLMDHLPKLKQLSLPVNQISDLPENIGLLKNLEMLDLSDNQLTDLPKQMGEMDSLEVLNIEKNVFINPLKTLEKLKGLNIKYLSVDPVMSDKDREKLAKIFPKAEIVEVVDTVSDESTGIGDLNYYDSLAYDTSDYEYRNIIVDGAKFQALSDAYLHYPVIFDRPNFVSTFDSLLFEERYMDTTYSNVWKIQPWRYYDNIRLYLYKSGVKGEIWFDFTDDYGKNSVPMSDPYVTKNNPEILAFLGMKWVYQGNLTKAQFVNKYIKKGKGYRYWMDVRIYYNERDKNFTIELKDQNGFTQINAYLRNRSKLIPLEKSQESYEGYFERYTKALDNRRKRFHKRLLKDKGAYDMTLQRSYIGAWESFRRVYMSPEEQRMSIKNWLDYYDKIIADEPKALYNAPPNLSLFERSLIINGYINANNSALFTDTTKMKGVYGMFRDDMQNMVAVTNVVVVNMNDKSFRTYEGSLGLKNIRLYFLVSAKYAIIAELRNGDVGVVRPSAFMQLYLHQNMEAVIPVERVSRKISTIGQIQEMIGL